MAADGLVQQVPPPLQDIPTAKEKKYDRQLRLWGAAGQIALENTHVLLINNDGPGVTGVETLKNLVLPGIGQFTILDSKIVTEADLGVNFFLEDASLGKSRAEETVRYLCELNPDVQGHALETLHDFDISQYTLVLLAAPVRLSILDNLENVLQRQGVPVFFFHSVGYYSHFSLHLPPLFPIVETHPDPETTTDLRLLKPWPELSEFAKKKTQRMDKMNGEEFAHIPWICLLLHYLEQWRAEHGGELPKDYKAKTQFRSLVRSGSASEENFDEACAAVLKNLALPEPSAMVRRIIRYPGVSIDQRTPPFWIIAHAVGKFYEKHNELPIPGAVPDMKAQSETYIQLQNIYKNKARQDCAEITTLVRETERLHARTSIIEEKEIENFCRNSAHLHVVYGRPLQIAGQSKFGSGQSDVGKNNIDAEWSKERVEKLLRDMKESSGDSGSAMFWAFQLWDQFYQLFDRFPGDCTHVHEDEAEIKQIMLAKLRDLQKRKHDSEMEDESQNFGNFISRVEDYSAELIRAGGAELHNIASLTGGMIAQEAIKVITKQYIPIDNTCLFDGITSRTYVGDFGRLPKSVEHHSG